MQNAETLFTILQDRGSKQLPLERVYRMLFNQELYLTAYAKLASNRGALTPGSTEETVDGMTLEKIDTIIDALRYERYQWTPVRRIYIAKPHSSKKRPLGLPSWSDKLVQEVIRSILSAYYEPQFSHYSHGFRPGRGCHSALHTIQQVWTGTRWFIEGDIAQYFDTIDHDVLLNTLGQRIHDNRFLRLISGLLKAGYLEDWKYNRTYSGTPQGGVLSPLLANIYLDVFDQFVETTLLPMFTRGTGRKANPAYNRVGHAIEKLRKKKDTSNVQALIQQRRTLPAGDPHDPNYRRLRYTRYADDFLLGVVGTRDEAQTIKAMIREFLRETLKLELSETKTLVTHATTQAARFLGYEIVNQQADHRITKSHRKATRSANGRIALRVPDDVRDAKCNRYMKDGKPFHRPELRHQSDYAIITRYQQEYRGIVEYYRMAHNLHSMSKLHWAMQTSLLKTLAGKHQTSLNKIWTKYKSTCATPNGTTMRCVEVTVERPGKSSLVARFGGISLSRNPEAFINDTQPLFYRRRSELLTRLMAQTCELCGASENIQVHHIRKLANLTKTGRRTKPAWAIHMIAMRRKTLVVCHTCHWNIHNGHNPQGDLK